MTDRQAREAKEKLIREKELSKVKISKDDVELIVSGYSPQITTFRSTFVERELTLEILARI